MNNKKYNEILNTFIDSFDNGTNCLYYFNDQSIPRGFGKTSILNEIGLIAQSQGMDVLSWSTYCGTTHIATERIVVGMTLGDGHLMIAKKGINACMRITHTEKQREYLEHKKALLEELTFVAVS